MQSLRNQSTQKAIFAGLALIFATSFAVMTMAAERWITKTSPHSVEVTADRLVAAIENGPPTLFARIDHAAGAKSAGLELTPSTVVLFGNPKLGTPIMQAAPKAALDLPMRILIWSQDGQTMMGALSPQALKDRYSIQGADKQFEVMNGAINGLMEAAAKP
ncbi:MAG: DUF302 domain-containing protein [Ahrensia sp.]|nr:DUF302 domain-containing protein [Ahrensia sp.]